jgi:hypothetical protein
MSSNFRQIAGQSLPIACCILIGRGTQNIPELCTVTVEYNQEQITVHRVPILVFVPDCSKIFRAARVVTKCAIAAVLILFVFVFSLF